MSKSISQNLTKGKLVYVDVLKGLAILAIILVHYNQAYVAPNPLIRSISGFGMHGVQIFFILSTFLLWRSLEKFTPKDNTSIFPFYLKKAYRLLPLYFAALVVYSLYSELMGNGIKWESLFLHFTLVNGLSPNHINDIMGIEWYVADLIILYLISPFLYRLINSLQRAVFCLFLALLLAFVINIIFQYLCSSNIIVFSNNVNLYFVTYAFFVQFPCMMLGCIFFYFFKQSTVSFIKGVMIFFIFSLIVCSATFFFQQWFKVTIVSNSTVCALTGGGILLIASRINWTSNFIIRMIVKPLIILGKHSFGIYLFLFLIIRIVASMISFDNTLKLYQWFSLYVVISLLSLGIGFVVEYIESSLKAGLKSSR